MKGLVLSLFPGIDLFGRGFELSGFCVVRAPDLIFGGDIRSWTGLPGRFDGVIGGPPCQDFSRARRSPATGNGVEMLEEFVRVVRECDPVWWLMENVPSVPKVEIRGYSYLRLDLDARDFGSRQRRLRHFQWGHKAGLVPIVTRCGTASPAESQPCCVASEGKRHTRRSWSEFCQLQGLPADFDLPAFTVEAKYRAVGNGVHVGVAHALADAIAGACAPGVRLCQCGCGRLVNGRSLTASAACRKRKERSLRAVTGQVSLFAGVSRV